MPNAQRRAQIRERISNLRQEIDALLAELGELDEPPPGHRHLHAVNGETALLPA